MTTRLFIFRHKLDRGEPPIGVIDDIGVRYAWAVKINGPSEVKFDEDGFYLDELPGRPHVRAWVETDSRVVLNS